MNQEAPLPDTHPSDLPDDDTAAPAAVKTPRRRRAATPAASQDLAEPGATLAGPTEGGEETQAPAARKTRRSPARAKSAPAAEEAVESAATETPAEIVPAVGAAEALEEGGVPPRRRSARKAAATPAPEAQVEGLKAVAAAEAPAAISEEPAAVAVDDVPAAPQSASADPGDAEEGLAVASTEAAVSQVLAQDLLAQASERFSEVVGGTYDQESESADAGAPEEAVAEKRVLRPQADAPKLQKVLAQSGLSSRRDIEQMIQDGRVAVNGEAAHIGQRVSFGDRIEVDGKPVKVRIAPPPARVLAYHKPVGEVVTFNDPEGRPTVFRHLPRLQHGKWQSVGRLDINTEGLLLFSTSGELANQLMHPRFGVEREYAVRVLGMLDAEKRAQLLGGVNIEGHDSCFRSIEDGGGEGVNHWYRVVIAEGRYREVRRLFDAVGLTVSRLIRIRYGNVVLPRGLKRGVWVELGEDEVRAIRRLAQPPSQRGGASQEGRGAAPQPQQQQRGRGPKPGPQGKGPRHGPPQQQGPRGQGGPEGRAPQAPRWDEEDDRQPGDPMFIPNPLEQTFDRRFAKGSKRIVAGFGRPTENPSGHAGPGGKKGGPRQPDPMQTSIGYIGADAFFRKSGGGGKRRGGGGGGGGGGNHGGGGGGGGSRGGWGR